MPTLAAVAAAEAVLVRRAGEADVPPLAGARRARPRERGDTRTVRFERCGADVTPRQVTYLPSSFEPQVENRGRRLGCVLPDRTPRRDMRGPVTVPGRR